MGGGSDNTELPGGFSKFISEYTDGIFLEIMLLLNLLSSKSSLLIGELDIQIMYHLIPMSKSNLISEQN